MDRKHNAARFEKIKALFSARQELMRTDEAVLVLKKVQHELPDEFDNDAQIGKFIEWIRKAKDSFQELIKSENWNPKQNAFYAKALRGCDEWIDFFHNHPLLGEFMTIDETVEALEQRATALRKKITQLANELDVTI
jgi:hypothetical protein